MTVLLAGRSVRAPDADAADVERVLDMAEVAATVTEVPATLDERLIALIRASNASAAGS
jgi:hypothetical protein